MLDAPVSLERKLRYWKDNGGAKLTLQDFQNTRHAVLTFDNQLLRPDYEVFDTIYRTLLDFAEQEDVYIEDYIERGRLIEYLVDYWSGEVGTSTTKRGERVQNALKRALLRNCKTWPKWDKVIPKYFAKHSSEFGKMIAEFYGTKKRMLAFVAPKKLIGEGIFEGGQTCLGEGRENGYAGRTVRTYKRAAMIGLFGLTDNDEITAVRARCLAFFYGAHNVVLTNFYARSFSRVELDKTFLKAFRALFNVDEAKLKAQQFGFSIVDGEGRNTTWFAPIYANHDGVALSRPNNAFTAYRRGLLKCPHCSDLVPAREFKLEMWESNVQLGCTECYPKKYRNNVDDCDCSDCRAARGEDDE